MKRSSHLKLTLMAATVPAALTGCDPATPTGDVLSSVEQCSSLTEISAEQCQAAYNKSLEEHQRVAPRFESSRECNEQFGNCTQIDENGRSFWMPAMTGFLIGYAMNGLGSSRNCEKNPTLPGCGGGGSRAVIGSSPLYRDYRSGDYYKPNGDLASNRTGPVTGDAGRTATPARAITVSRSGFGSTSAARSSFGGGSRGS